LETLLYYLFVAFAYIVKITPSFLKEPLKKVVALLFYLIASKRRKIVARNIELILGKRDKEIEKKAFLHFVDNLFDIIENLNITKEELERKVVFKNRELADNFLKDGPAIFVTAHYGNWELTPTIMAAFITPIDAVVRKLSLKKFNELIERPRARFGVTLHNRKDGVRNLIKSLKSGRSLGILVDQYPNSTKGVTLPFFGHNIPHTDAAVVLAKKFNIPVIILFLEKENGKYVMNFVDGFYVDDKNKALKRQVKVIEDYISKDISKWYLFHRRFRPVEKYIF